MPHRFFSIYLLVFLLIGCGPTEPDTLGDLLVRLDTPAFGFPGTTTTEVGVFPSETLITEEFTSEMSIKTAPIIEGQAVITNLLPGIYVVAVFTNSASRPRQVVQIVADEVTIVDFDLNPLNEE